MTNSPLALPSTIWMGTLFMFVSFDFIEKLIQIDNGMSAFGFGWIYNQQPQQPVQNWEDEYEVRYTIEGYPYRVKKTDLSQDGKDEYVSKIKEIYSLE